MTPLADLKIQASATIEKYRSFTVTKKKRVRKTKPPKRYRADRNRGKGTVIVCVSMPERELDLVDRMALASQMSRSHFIREAAKSYDAAGLGAVVQFCLSVPPGDLALLDALAHKAQTNRSHFIRQAVKHFGVKLFPELDPHDPKSVEKFSR